MNATTDSSVPPSQNGEPSKRPRKPHISYIIATSFGLGYLKPGPGTFGSLAGLIAATAGWWAFIIVSRTFFRFGGSGIGIDIAVRSGSADFDTFIFLQIQIAVALAVIGVFAASRVATYSGIKDPQFVVIDEVSGQQLTLLLGGFGPVRHSAALSSVLWSGHPLALPQFLHSGVNWRYLLLGFILFRVFDIWNPFPVHQAESLPGGWGIMADDWLAAVYAAMGLWIARAAGL